MREPQTGAAELVIAAVVTGTKVCEIEQNGRVAGLGTFEENISTFGGEYLRTQL